jgi:hypothetical protein
MEQMEEYNRLKVLVEGNSNYDVHDFLYFCYLHSELFNTPHEICMYRAMLVRLEMGEHLKKDEKAWLEQKRAKYSSLEALDWANYTKYSNELRDAKDVKRHLEEASNDLIAGISSSTQELPGLIEYIKSLRNNLTFSASNTDLRPKYDADAMQELFHCLDNFKSDSNIWITEEICITLTQRVFIHILSGHIEKHFIPRKGLAAKFEEHHWIGLYNMIVKIVHHLHDELIVHFSFPGCGSYDNREIIFEGKAYGIHIDDRGYIKTFYPVTSSIKNSSA